MSREYYILYLFIAVPIHIIRYSVQQDLVLVTILNGLYIDCNYAGARNRANCRYAVTRFRAPVDVGYNFQYFCRNGMV